MTSNGRNWDDPEYKKWRLAVKRRDKFTCQWPNCQCKKKIQVHHIRRWSDAPMLRYAIDNGITLCRTHHDLIKGKEDSYAGTFLLILFNQKRLNGQTNAGGKKGRRKKDE